MLHSLSDDLDDERVVEAGVDEVLGAIIEDKIDTSELLKALKQATCHQALANGALEALHVGSSADRELVAMVGLDLSKLFNNSRMVDRQATKFR